MSDDTPVIPSPSTATVDEAPPPKVLLYRADGSIAVKSQKVIGFNTTAPSRKAKQ